LVVAGDPPLTADCADGGLIVVWFADLEVEEAEEAVIFSSVTSGFRGFLSLKAADTS
jgi:hypothetical protein